MSLKMPAAGAGTSIVTLSVSSSTSGSSTATASPAFLNHLPMVASVTDSPSVGTRISVMASSFAGESIQGFVQEMLELGEMQRHLSDRGRRRSRPAGITGAAVLGADLVEHPFQEDVDEHPAAHIARLFLTPDDLGFLEARQFGHQRLGRERIELLDAEKINVVDAALLALLVEVVIDLAGAKHDAAYLVVGDELDL